MTRWRATAVLAALLLLPLAGCQARAGTAAFVGPTRIADDQLHQVADEGVRVKAISTAVSGNVGAYRRLMLGRLIKRLVIAGAARKLGVSVTEGQVDQAISGDTQRAGGRKQLDAALAAAPLQLPPSQLRPFLRDSILLDRIGTRFTAGLTFTDAELKKFYDDNGGAQSGQSFAQLKPRVLQALQQQRGIARAQQYVRQYLHTQKVTVNPRYGTFNAAKLFDANESPLVVGARDDLVRDAGATLS